MNDVIVENHGTLFMFYLMTDEAHQFVEEFVQAEPWQWSGNGLAVGHGFALDLYEWMTRGGLKVA